MTESVFSDILFKDTSILETFEALETNDLKRFFFLETREKNRYLHVLEGYGENFKLEIYRIDKMNM